MRLIVGALGLTIILAAHALAGPLPFEPVVASDGTSYLVCWIETASNPETIDCATVAADGSISVAPHVALTPAYGPKDLTLAYGGGEFVLAHADTANVQLIASRLSVAAAPLGDTAIAMQAASVSQGGSLHDIAFGSGEFMIVWTDVSDPSNDNIHAARLLPDGTLLDPAAIRVSDAAGHQLAPTVSFNGSDFIVTWSNLVTNGADVWAARVSTAGLVRDPAGVRLLAGGFLIESAVSYFGSDGILISGNGGAWSFARFDTSLNVTSSGTLNFPGQVFSNTMDIATNATEGLVTWGASAVARIGPSGTLLDPAGIATPAQMPNATVVASNGTDFLFAWTTWRNELCPNASSADLRIARVAAEGTVLDPNGITLVMGDPLPGPGPECFPESDPADGWRGTGGSGSSGDAANAGADHSTGCGCFVGGSAQPPFGIVLLLLLAVCARRRKT